MFRCRLCFFVSNVATLFWHMGGKRSVAPSDAIQLITSLICSACWIFLMTRQGEERTVSLGLRRDPIEERHLLDQLDSLNSTLLRRARE